MFDAINTVVLITLFVGLIEGPICKFGVSINVSWATKCTRLIPRPTVESIVVNGVFMLCGNI